jgi:methionine sulfoxide reductase heme-binding subunit
LNGSFLSRYWLRRGLQLLLLCAAAIFVSATAYWLTPPPDFRHRLSMATAYAALCFLAATLLLGPWNVRRHRTPPVSYDLRRDIGILTGGLALIHTAIGLNVHLRGRMWMYFFRSLHPLQVQATTFGAANYTGLSATLIFLMLLALSNDWSLRVLGTPRWKKLQRWTYAAFTLTAVHAILFQCVENRRLPWIVFFATTVTITIAAQWLGYWRRRQRHVGKSPESARSR